MIFNVLGFFWVLGLVVCGTFAGVLFLKNYWRMRYWPVIGWLVKPEGRSPAGAPAVDSGPSGDFQAFHWTVYESVIRYARPGYDR